MEARVDIKVRKVELPEFTKEQIQMISNYINQGLSLDEAKEKVLQNNKVEEVKADDKQPTKGA